MRRSAPWKYWTLTILTVLRRCAASSASCSSGQHLATTAMMTINTQILTENLRGKTAFEAAAFLRTDRKRLLIKARAAQPSKHEPRYISASIFYRLSSVAAGDRLTIHCLGLPSDSQSPATPFPLANTPLAGYVEDFHLQVTSVATTAELIELTRNAPCLAHKHIA